MTENANPLPNLNLDPNTEGPRVPAGKAIVRSRTMKISVVGGVIVVGMLAVGYIPRTMHAKEAEEAARQRKGAVPDVATYVVRPGNPRAPLALPGNVEPITEAVIYARSDGYVNKRLVDIGDRVRTGQLLGVISSPETDQELQMTKEALAQSRSDYEMAKAATDEAKANLFIADITNRRWQDLVARNVVSQEEADQTQSAYMAREADVTASQAKERATQDAIRVNEARVQRLRELVSYERVVAPFPGVITARNIDIGSLVSSGSNANIPVLYKLGKIDRMRIFADVPQADSEYIHVGQTCSIQVRELPNRVFAATVTRFANAIDIASRTMRTEVQIDNPNGELLPGMYAQVQFDLERTKPPILIPANTLVVSTAGDEVVVVKDGVTHFRTIEVALDYGPEIEVGGGVAFGDSLVANVNDSIRDNERVKVVSHIELPPPTQAQTGKY
jgi:RND family efflux transporter MFP subunit